MLSRSLLARSSPIRLSATLRVQVCSRSLSSLRLAQPAPSFMNVRRFSAAPVFRTENRVEHPTSHAPSGTCYIANIPYKVTAEQLKDAFSEFGKVESVRLRTSHPLKNACKVWVEADPGCILLVTSDAGLSRGIGFVRFELVEEAIRFVEANQADPIFVMDRQLFVEHAQKTRNVSKPVEPSNTLMVLDFQGGSEVEVRTMFGSYAENILAVRFSKSRVFFIHFAMGVESLVFSTQTKRRWSLRREQLSSSSAMWRSRWKLWTPSRTRMRMLESRMLDRDNPRPTHTLLHLDYHITGPARRAIYSGSLYLNAIHSAIPSAIGANKNIIFKLCVWLTFIAQVVE